MVVAWIAFLCLLRTSAEVPHWVKQTSPGFDVPSMKKVMGVALSLQSKLAKQTPNTRRLVAIMSAECAAACPGVKDMMTFMAGSATATTTALPEGTTPEVAMMLAMCDHADAIACAGTAEACKDPPPEGAQIKSGDDEDPSTMQCFCACPAVATFSDPAQMCADKDATVGCLTSTSTCESTVKKLGGTRMADATCKMHDLKCEALGAQLIKCAGIESMTTFQGECSQAAMELKLADKKDTCCPLLKTVMGCHKKECVELSWEVQQIQAEAGDEQMKRNMEANFQWGKVCTDSGLAGSKDELEASISGKRKKGAATDSSTGPAVSLFTMATAMVSLIA